MEQIKRPDLNVMGERFETFDEMYRVCESRELRPYYSTDYGAKDTRQIHDDKNIRYTWEQTKNDIMFGSDVFSDDFERIRKEVDAEAAKYMQNYVRPMTKKDIVGQSVLVERALVGHPKAFNRRQMARRKQKAVHLMFNITCAWYVSTDKRLRSGCILMAVAEGLEKMGYQTAITYTPYFSYKPSSEPSLIAEVRIKDYRTRFNPKKIQFPVAAESVLFQLGCWWMHRTPVGKSNWGDGEGICVDYNDRRKQQAKNYAREMKAVYLSNPIIIDDCDSSVNKVFEYVFKCLDEM